MRRRWLLVLLLLVTLPIPVSAGGITGITDLLFGKKGTKPTPQERVPQLIRIIREDGDENKRSDAVEELRQYDPLQFPEIMPTLIDALMHDKKPAVRSEAAHSISKLRPVTQTGGQALERALANDPAMRVRIQVRSALLSYQWAGYRSSGKKDDMLLMTKEPPLADPPVKVPPLTPARMTAPPQPAPLIDRQPSYPPPSIPGPSLGLPSSPVPVPVPLPKPVAPAGPRGPDLF